MADARPTLLWLRRDLRQGDHPGWQAALDGDGPVVPVFILDPLIEETYGAAPLWRLGQSIAALGATLRHRGSRLILRRGEALSVLRDLVAETNATGVVWSRLYEPRAIARDTGIKEALKSDCLDVQSVNASLLFEPWQVETRAGGFFKVYSPFWRAVEERTVHEPIVAPSNLKPPPAWPPSDRLEDWHLGRAMNRGAAVLADFATVGEDQAAERLEHFATEKLRDYDQRDFPEQDVCSRLSENLAYGEISPRQIWTRIQNARRAAGPALSRAATKFLKELVWREFAYHLMYHTPHMLTDNWRPEWDGFSWRGDNADAEAWRRGMTGIDMVDAGMREMYVTGTMHNRVRMLVASFLTKHLLVDWRVGAEWFRECLIDWDPASNAMGWQWTAGSGPDAAPYFRVFNPDLQAAKFDPSGVYRGRWLSPKDDFARHGAHFFRAAPRSWHVDPDAPRPGPIICLRAGRERALAAYSSR